VLTLYHEKIASSAMHEKCTLLSAVPVSSRQYREWGMLQASLLNWSLLETADWTSPPELEREEIYDETDDDESMRRLAVETSTTTSMYAALRGRCRRDHDELLGGRDGNLQDRISKGVAAINEARAASAAVNAAVNTTWGGGVNCSPASSQASNTDGLEAVRMSHGLEMGCGLEMLSVVTLTKALEQSFAQCSRSESCKRPNEKSQKND